MLDRGRGLNKWIHCFTSCAREYTSMKLEKRDTQYGDDDLAFVREECNYREEEFLLPIHVLCNVHCVLVTCLLFF